MTDISSNLEELTLNQIHVPLDTSLNEAIRSRQMIYIDLSFCSMVTDKSIIKTIKPLSFFSYKLNIYFQLKTYGLCVKTRQQ